MKSFDQSLVYLLCHALEYITLLTYLCYLALCKLSLCMLLLFSVFASY
jgi:hypothetical protein